MLLPARDIVFPPEADIVADVVFLLEMYVALLPEEADVALLPETDVVLLPEMDIVFLPGLM